MVETLDALVQFMSNSKALTESTNTRVLFFSIFSMFILVLLGTWQIFYLKKFFKSKKMI